MNKQVDKFVSWKPEPGAWAVDAFHLSWKPLTFYAFPPFSLIGRVLRKVQQEEAEGILVVPLWTTQPWFPHLLRLLIDHPRIVSPPKHLLYLPGRPDVIHPLHHMLTIMVVHLSGQLKTCASWRKGTQCQYSSSLKSWRSFCTTQKVDPYTPSIKDILHFLTELCNTGAGYSVIATARSALPGIISIPGIPSISEHLLVKRLLKGVYHHRPPRPRYTFIWDTSVVIEYLQTLKNDDISFKIMSLIIVMLLTLLSMQRISTIQHLHLLDLHLTTDVAIFSISALLKHTKHGRKNAPIMFNNLVTDVDQLIITHGKPHRAASKDTMARWLKETMMLAGVDTSIFKPHSCRAASSSQASMPGVPLMDILHNAQWKSTTVFFKHYHRFID